jgi:adenylate cyclase
MTAAQPERRLAAVLFADVVEYSRLMGDDEIGTLARLNAHLEQLVKPLLTQHKGALVKLTGDGVLCYFGSVVKALECSVAIQRGIAEREQDVPEAKRMRLRIGINQGDILIEENDIHGHAVNVAARLEHFAEPGGICVSGKVREEVNGQVPYAFRDLGEQHLKNMARRVRLCHVIPEPGQEDQPPPDSLSESRVAVLPFNNSVPRDQRGSLIANRLSADIINDLAQDANLEVIAYKTMLTYKDRSADIRTIGRELGVAYVLEGDVEAASGRVRIAARLVRAREDVIYWSISDDRLEEDLLATQKLISDGVTNAIVSWRSEQTKRKPLSSVGAYELYQLGVEEVDKLTQEGNAEGIRLLSRAVELDPDLAGAWTALAFAHYGARLYGFTEDLAATDRKWRECAERALALNPSDPKAHVTMGDIHACAGDLSAAKDEYEMAVAVGPNHADALALVAASFSLVVGDPERAVNLVLRAIRLNPGGRGLGPPKWYNLTLGRAEYVCGNYSKSIEALQRAPRDAPATLMFLAMAHAQLGKTEEVETMATQLSTEHPGFNVAKFIHHFPVTNPPAVAAIRDGATKAGLLPPTPDELG